MSVDFVIRIVGRFVFACEKSASDPASVHAVAMNMGYNPDLHSDPHRTVITVRRSDINPRVSSLATMSTFVPIDNADDRDELFVWEAAGCDVSLEGTDGAPYSFDGWETVPDLAELSDGDTFDADLLRTPLSARTPVAARIAIPGCGVKAVQFDPGKKVAFERLEELAPANEPTRPLADVVDLEVSTTGRQPLLIALRSLERGRRTIVVPVPEPDPSTPNRLPRVIVISNLCATRAPVDGHDREFASYYDTLRRPRPARDRRVPFTMAGPAEGSRADCTGVAKAAYAP